jgi:large subunit ribosomal protein L4
MVQGSTRKVRMQKYTGRARHGSIRAPIYVGGGIVFGPQPRDFGLAINKKMRRLAIRSALSGKVADGQLIVIDELAFKAPRTKEMLGILRNVGIQRSALIVTGEADRSVLASARNIHKTKVLPAAYLNVGDMLNHAHVLMTEEAVKVAEGLWGAKRADGRRAAKPVAEALAREQARPSARRRAKAEAPPEEPEPADSTAVAEAAAPKPRARRAAAAPEASAAGEPKPKRPTRRAKTAPEPPAEEAPKPRADARPSGRRRTKKTDESG